MKQTLEFFCKASTSKAPTLTAQVKRMDTHGNIYTLRTQMHPEAAEQLATEMENRGHKQTYWVEKEQSPHPK